MTRPYAFSQQPWFQLKYMKQNSSQPITGQNIRHSFGKELEQIEQASDKIRD